MKKVEREKIRSMFDGRCAYCGVELGDRWHADHIEPVERVLKFVRDKGLVATGEFHRPQNHRIENIWPACPPCNIDKHTLTIEQWRKKLADACNVLRRNQPTYRHALRFGLVEETGNGIRFHFEKD